MGSPRHVHATNKYRCTELPTFTYSARLVHIGCTLTYLRIPSSPRTHFDNSGLPAEHGTREWGYMKLGGHISQRRGNDRASLPPGLAYCSFGEDVSPFPSLQLLEERLFGGEEYHTNDEEGRQGVAATQVGKRRGAANSIRNSILLFCSALLSSTCVAAHQERYRHHRAPSSLVQVDERRYCCNCPRCRISFCVSSCTYPARGGVLSVSLHGIVWRQRATRQQAVFARRT